MAVNTAVRSRIPELRQLIGQVGSRRQDVATRLANRTGPVLLTMIRGQAPVGQVEKEYVVQRGSGQSVTISHGRPSSRLHGVTLERSWLNPIVKPNQAGATFLLATSTRQAEILLAGAPVHPLSGKPYLSFWYFRDGRPVIVTKLPKDHPGFPPRNFVERAYYFRGQAMLIAARNQGLRELILPVKNFFT